MLYKLVSTVKHLHCRKSGAVSRFLAVFSQQKKTANETVQKRFYCTDEVTRNDPVNYVSHLIVSPAVADKNHINDISQGNNDNADLFQRCH